MQDRDSSKGRRLQAETPADVRRLLQEHGLPAFAYFDRQLEQEVRRAHGAWPLLAREVARRMADSPPAVATGEGG
jgi:hypothetical protein